MKKFMLKKANLIYFNPMRYLLKYNAKLFGVLICACA